MLLEQKLNVALYDSTGKETIISNVHITENVKIEKIHENHIDKLPSAILVNANNKGYCRTIIDKKSLAFFMDNLSKVSDDGNRSYIWRCLIDHINMDLLSTDDYFKCVLKNIEPEELESVIPYVLMNAKHVLRNYFKTEKRIQVREEFFNVLLRKLYKTENPSLKNILVSSMLDLATTDE
jgi:hypothetical protein